VRLRSDPTCTDQVVGGLIHGFEAAPTGWRALPRRSMILELNFDNGGPVVYGFLKITIQKLNLNQMTTKGKIPAISYLRTSSAANVGADKDSDRRQREAIQAFATRAGYELVGEFYDAAVSGADPIDTRPGFADMLERIEGNGVRTIIVETASRFARDLMVQEVGHAKLRERGIDLIAADNPGSFIDATPTAKLVRQVLGAISEFDKAMTVAKLRGARERKRRDTGKCEGRKSHAERNPELVALVRQLRRKRPKGGQRSLRDISAELAQRGIMNERGTPFSAASIASMLERRSV
jgi:DNA invertase Pin-like site-specific DNA recombinase